VINSADLSIVRWEQDFSSPPVSLRAISVPDYFVAEQFQRHQIFHKIFFIFIYIYNILVLFKTGMWKTVEYFLLLLSAPLEVSCFRVRFHFLTLGIFCFRFQLWIKLVASEFASASSLFSQNASPSFRSLPLPPFSKYLYAHSSAQN